MTTPKTTWAIRYSSPCGRTAGTAHAKTAEALASTLAWMDAEGYAYDVCEKQA